MNTEWVIISECPSCSFTHNESEW